MQKSNRNGRRPAPVRNGALSARRTSIRAAAAAAAAAILAVSGGAFAVPLRADAAENSEEVVLRVCNWEEYIDLGDWDEEETIELDSGNIIGENSMVEDFETWYEETYGVKVKVEYSTFGTNEDLYNMLTLGDEFDLVCPSEYMIMKLMREGQTVPLSEEFFDPSDENNYYIKGVSPYIKKIFDEHEIDGEPWSRYAAGYMWGVTGIVYNPEVVEREEASTWKILSNPKYSRQVTIKDNVRDSYFAAVGAIKSDLLMSEEFRSAPDYAQRLEDEMNDTSPEMIAKVQDYLQECKDNVYSFETDSGKADMITGKVVANYQWSGDGVMYYIGYTSVISGGGDPTIFEYADYNYSAEEGEETEEYDLSYFFAEEGEETDEYVIEASPDMLERQLYAAYPPDDVMRRSSIMTCFDEEQTKAINQMWINVRCFNLSKMPFWGWIFAAVVIAGVVFLAVRRFQNYKKRQ